MYLYTNTEIFLTFQGFLYPKHNKVEDGSEKASMSQRIYVYRVLICFSNYAAVTNVMLLRKDICRE